MREKRHKGVEKAIRRFGLEGERALVPRSRGQGGVAATAAGHIDESMPRPGKRKRHLAAARILASQATRIRFAPRRAAEAQARKATAAAAAEAAAMPALVMPPAAAPTAAARDLDCTAGFQCDLEWERLELQCALSFQRLVDPARGNLCKHSSRCNYKDLRTYVGRVQVGQRCPIAGCKAKLQRVLAIERDTWFRDALLMVPAEVDAVWVNRSRSTLCTEAPESAWWRGKQRKGDSIDLT